MKKKLLALVLACAMALGLAACGGSKAKTEITVTLPTGMTPPRRIWWVSASWRPTRRWTPPRRALRTR